MFETKMQKYNKNADHIIHNIHKKKDEIKNGSMKKQVQRKKTTN